MALANCVGCGVPFVPQASETICPLCVAEVRAGDRRTDLTNTMVQTGPLPPVPLVLAAPRPSSGRLVSAGEDMECPLCAETIKAKAKICKHCGSNVEAAFAFKPSPRGPLDTRGSRVRGRGAPSRWIRRDLRAGDVSIGVAGLLSMLMPGLGQLYAGAAGRAVFFLFVGPAILVAFAVTLGPGAGLALAGVGGLVLWITSIWDAMTCAEDYNRRRAPS